jgi:hypothetical protein
MAKLGAISGPKAPLKVHSASLDVLFQHNVDFYAGFRFRQRSTP